jgi:hypothetical protein
LFPRIPTQPNEVGSGRVYIGWTGWEKPNTSILILDKVTYEESIQILYKTFPFEFQYTDELWKLFEKIGHVNCSFIRAIRLNGIEPMGSCTFTVKRVMKAFLSGRFEAVVNLELVAEQEEDYYECSVVPHMTQAGEDVEAYSDMNEIIEADDVLRHAGPDKSELPDDSVAYLYADNRKLSNSKDIRTLERFQFRHHKKHSRFELRNIFDTYVPQWYSDQFVDEFYMEDSDNCSDIDSSMEDELGRDFVPHVACDRWLQRFPTNADRIRPLKLEPRKFTFVDFSKGDHVAFPNAEKKERHELGPAIPVRIFGPRQKWMIVDKKFAWF